MGSNKWIHAAGVKRARARYVHYVFTFLKHKSFFDYTRIGTNIEDHKCLTDLIDGGVREIKNCDYWMEVIDEVLCSY